MIRETVRTIPDRRLLAWLLSWVLLGAALFAARPASTQELDAAALEDLVAPVALYPDDLLGIVLPASTFPLEIVSAARFLDDLEDDPTLTPDPDWDDSIVALLNYPEVLRMMDENIDWTWELGEAVLTDQAAVLDAAQRFRSRAYAAGNLSSDERQTVSNTSGKIEIAPASPEVIYVPVYEPREVVVYQPVPVWYYYPVAYPVYYYPYPAGYSFSVGFFWGVSSYFSIGWHSHYVHVHHHTHYGHPYYLNTYYSYAPYYPRNHVNITVAVDNYDHVWQPSPRRGNRPDTVTVAGRTSAMRTPRSASVESQGTRSASVESPANLSRSSSGSPGANAQRMSAGDAASSAGNSRAPQSSNARGAQSPTRAAPQSAISAPDQGNASTRTPGSSGSSTRMTGSRPSPSNARPSADRPTTTTTPVPQASMAPQQSTRSSSSSGSSRGQALSQRPSGAAPAPSGQPGVGASTRSNGSANSNASTRSSSGAAPRMQGSTRSNSSQAPSSTRASTR